MRAIPEKNINEGEGLVGTYTPYSLNQHLFTFLKSGICYQFPLPIQIYVKCMPTHSCSFFKNSPNDA